MRVLIRYLKNENRREETLRALKISLQAWSKSEVTTEISLFESLLLENTCSANPGQPFPFWTRTVLLFETGFSSLWYLTVFNVSS